MPIDIINALIPGLIMGILFGFVLQRGRFCMNSAIRDPLLLKDTKLMKAVLMAIFAQMIGFAILHATGIIVMAPKPLMLAAQIIGGFIFGIGMTFAAGCASGTTYRTGEGMVGSIFALIGLAIGAYMTSAGALAPIKDELQSVVKIPGLTIGGEFTWLIMIIVGIAGVVLMVFSVLREKKKSKEKEGEKTPFTFSNLGHLTFKQSWPWWITGIAVAIIGTITYALPGTTYALGITGGWAGLVKYVTTGNEGALGFGVWLVIGAVIGAFIAAFIAGEWKLRAPKDPKTLLTQLGGGFLMGFGAVLAAGCNIGNLLSGVPQLSVGSIVASAAIIGGGLLSSYLMFMRD